MEKDLFKIKKQIGQDVARCLKEKRWTRYKVAKLTGLSGNQVSSIIKGDTNYTIDSLVTVCHSVGVQSIALIELKY